MPLIAGDHRMGVLDVWREGFDSFSERDLEQCALFAHMTAAAWNNAQLYRELEERTRTDALTDSTTHAGLMKCLLRRRRAVFGAAPKLEFC